MEVMEKNPGHPFNKIPLMSSPLLFELKEHCLTFELNNHFPLVTGILPHIDHLCQIDEVGTIILGIKEDISDFCQHLSNLVSEGIDKKVQVDGVINSEILDKQLKNMEQLLLRQMDDLDRSSISPTVAQPLNEEGDVLDLEGLQRRNLFSYGGNFGACQKILLFQLNVLVFMAVRCG
jgi:hypothetical protein